jgi:hypothetical protein
MRNLVLAASLACFAALSSGCAPAHALETFDLGERDKILYEAQGCSADCIPVSPQRRSCSVKGLDCKVVCQSLADCRPDGGIAMNVCVVVKR